MDAVRKDKLSEGVPLNSKGAANIFLNTGKNSKLNPQDGTVIHLNTGAEKTADVDVHINTTFSVASSKKIKLLFIVNFLLSVGCVVVSCTVAFYYWNEMLSMRRQLDLIKEQVLLQSVKNNVLNIDRMELSSLVSNSRLFPKDQRQPRMEPDVRLDISPNARRYYVEDLGEDMLLVDSSKKDPSKDQVPAYDLTTFQKDLLVIHFNGAIREINLGTKSMIGPWVHDATVSSKNSHEKVELDTNNNYVTIKESGLYIVYAQVVYLTHAPNCYLLWARQPAQKPRLLTTCATGDDSSSRPLEKSQISCSVQTVARLYKGDTVNLVQREENRTLWLRPGYSYFGFIKLSS